MREWHFIAGEGIKRGAGRGAKQEIVKLGEREGVAGLSRSMAK